MSDAQDDMARRAAALPEHLPIEVRRAIAAGDRDVLRGGVVVGIGVGHWLTLRRFITGEPGP